MKEREKKIDSTSVCICVCWEIERSGRKNKSN